MMRISALLLLLSFFLASGSQAQNKVIGTDSVEIINDFKGSFKYQNYYLSAQPSLEALRWYKSQGVNYIINLRTENENKDFSAYAFNEENIAKELGLEYHSLPIGGSKDYTPENLERFEKLIKGDEKLLIHCRSAGRATIFFMAYLIQHKGYSVNEAAKIGRQIKFSLPLEKLLDTELSLEMVK
jgi:protein tyrosine phosphatase (PTP) superfamily phosphohydrolase (DUF442 family)